MSWTVTTYPSVIGRPIPKAVPEPEATIDAPLHRRPKAADIPDEVMLRAILSHCRQRDMWACWWQIAEVNFPSFPEKVVLAKVRALLGRNLISGCGCSCRGDLELTDSGYERIGEQRRCPGIY